MPQCDYRTGCRCHHPAAKKCQTLEANHSRSYRAKRSCAGRKIPGPYCRAQLVYQPWHTSRRDRRLSPSVKSGVHSQSDLCNKPNPRCADCFTPRIALRLWTRKPVSPSESAVTCQAMRRWLGVRPLGIHTKSGRLSGGAGNSVGDRTGDWQLDDLHCDAPSQIRPPNLSGRAAVSGSCQKSSERSASLMKISPFGLSEAFYQSAFSLRVRVILHPVKVVCR